MGDAVGFLEVHGLVTAFVAADAACKAANVTIQSFDRNKPANADKMPVPLLILVKIRGSVSDVNAALEAAAEAANKHAGYMTKHVIASPDKDTENMLKIDEIAKK